MAEQVARRSIPSIGRELLAVGTFALAALVAIALATFDDRDIAPGVGSAHNLIGPVGAWVAHGLYAAFGYASYLLVAALLLAGVFSLLRWPHFGWHRTAGGLLFLPTLGLLMHLGAMSPDDVAGGALGEAMGEGLRAIVHNTGAWIVALALLTLALLLSTPLSLLTIGRWLRASAGDVHQWYTVRRVRWERRRVMMREKREARREAEHRRSLEKERVAAEKAECKRVADEARSESKRATEEARFAAKAAAVAADPDVVEQAMLEGSVERALSRTLKRRGSKGQGEGPTSLGGEPALVLDDADVVSAEPVEPPSAKKGGRGAPAGAAGAALVAGAGSAPASAVGRVATPVTAGAEDDALSSAELAVVAPSPSPFVEDAPAVERTAAANAARKTPPPVPKIVEPTYREKPLEEPRQASLFLPLEAREWKLPELGLLDYDESSHITFDREDLMRQAERLTKALADFRIEGRVVEIHPGPVVTMYEFELAAGTKVKQVQSLEDDLALALQAVKVRITAIPGKGVLGIEVANRERETVYLKEIIGSEKFHKVGSKLPMALGKDISGQAVVTDLAKMPHLLVAGTTGSGKSVGLNSMLISIMYSATPEDVRLILVDQKTTEFGPYDGLPHLLLPVVVDPKRAAVALRWAVEEMERRYGLMSELGVRHILGYNKRIEQMKANGEGFPADEPIEGEEALPPTPVEKMPYIVIMIDELADLMMVAPREVEGSLQRLAQMARASGIHIIIATQRPSVDVVSGVIRANFPARIAFQTRTRVDSRTILDDGGAEQLLGMGDMLLLPPGTSTLQRVHGAFVSDAEVKRVVDAWKEQGKPNYDASILQVRAEDGDGAATDEPPDEMYDQAIAIVAETRQVSISMIQRRLRVGYNRSARMVERMEREQIIGPNLGPNQPREIYVSAQS